MPTLDIRELTLNYADKGGSLQALALAARSGMKSARQEQINAA